MGPRRHGTSRCNGTQGSAGENYGGVRAQLRNHRAIETFQKRSAQHISLDAFLNAETKSSMKGTRLWREKGAIVQAYCPSEYTRPMRCYCALVNGLPANKTMSATYCQCSRAFVQQMWEESLGRPVSVTLLKSAVAGAKECHFQINFKE
jgi:hypothetical protein